MARVLLVGAGGFIGSAIAHALIEDGHQVTALGRNLDHGRRAVPEASWRKGDLRTMTLPERWADAVLGIDFVVNASGALQTGLRDDVTAVQRDAIATLAEAARRANVRHFVQISAAGADAGAATDFMASKAAADAAITATGLACTVLHPGLVIGRSAFGGTELLRTAAALPATAPEITGAGLIQCVALSDVVAAVRRVLTEPARFEGSFDMVEASRHSLGAVIAAHRTWLGFPAARWRPKVSLVLFKPLTLCADLLGWLGWRSPLRSNAIAALAVGVRGDADQARAVLGRDPLDLAATLAAIGPAGKADRWHARLALIYPLALAVLGLLWLVSGVLGLLRIDEAAALLVHGGVSPGLARLAVLAGSLVDIAIAGAMLVRPMLRQALGAGLAVAIAYCFGAFAVRPDLWLDPLAPMLKVLPMVVLTLACLAMADER